MARIVLGEKNKQITIARKTFPSLRATAMKDFFQVLREWGVYRPDWHNKSENIYRNKKTGSEIDFLSIDDPFKVRSRRRDYAWLNEGNEFDLEDYRQISMRTSGQIFTDYNPSHQFHWIYDELETRKDCKVIQSTYLDNPFLHPDIVKEIEGYRDKDENYWRIYGLGFKGISQTTVYTHWKFCDDLPESYDDEYYGLDFGYNNPTALVQIREKDKDIFVKEKLYQSYLTNEQLIEKFKGLDIGNKIIYADSAEPQRIEEIRQAGFNIRPADKDVALGIDEIKRRAFYITKDSVKGTKEVKSYSWKTKDGKPIDEPVAVNNHFCDATRYGVYSNLKKYGFIGIS